MRKLIKPIRKSPLAIRKSLHKRMRIPPTAKKITGTRGKSFMNFSFLVNQLTEIGGKRVIKFL